MTGRGPTPNLGGLHDDTAALHPEWTAVIDGENDRRVAYGEFADRVAAAGHVLADLGVERGDRVALLFPNQVPYLYAFFGAARLGAVPVPVNVRMPTESMAYVVEDAGAAVAVASARESIRTEAAEIAGRVDGLGTVGVAGADGAEAVAAAAPDATRVLDFSAAVADAPTDLDPVPVSPDDPALQPYTSGSTGRPKGVVLSHGGTDWNVTTVRQVHFLDGDDRAVVAAPLYHKNAMIGAIKPMLQVGGSVVLMDGFDADAVVAAIDAYDVTYLRGVPAMYKMLVEADEALAAHDVSTVEWVVSGSASLPEALIERFRETFGAPMGEAYGLTEGGPVVTLSPRWGVRRVGSSGLALPGAETMVVDPETGEECPPGEVGELLVDSPGVGRYHDRPETTAEAFEERDGKRFLHTEDLARIDEDGYHYIVGRLDDMLVVGGENVYPAEVEGYLQRHDAVADVAVVGVPHEVKGEAPVAFVVATEAVTEADLKEFVLDYGPAYAHPRRVFFLDELPLAGTGKIDRDALESEARERIGGAL